MLNYLPANTSHLKSLSRMVNLLKVLAEPNRLQIFNLLMEGVQCNCELGDHLQMPPNLISHHLSVLRDAGLVIAERDEFDSRWVYYSINRTIFEELVASFNEIFNPARIKSRSPSCGPKKKSNPQI